MKVGTLISIGLTVMIFTAALYASPATDYTFVREFGQPGIASNQFSDMDGIAVDRFGNVFVADLLASSFGIGFTNENLSVKRWSMDGIYEHFWFAYDRSQWPAEGIDCSCDGEPFYVSPVYISPDIGANIEHTSADGMFYEKFPPPWSPAAYTWFAFRDVAVSGDGDVYGIVYFNETLGNSNFLRAAVMKYEWTGTVWSNVAKFVTKDDFETSDRLWGIDVDVWRQRVYVTALATPGRMACVKVLDLDLIPVDLHLPWEYGAQPTGVAVDNRNGAYLVTESLSNRIYKFAVDGTQIMMFGRQGTNPYEFNGPTDLDVDMRGWLFVADSGNDKVQVYAPPKEGNLNFIVYKSKVKVGWKQKLKGKDRDILMCKAWAALDVYTNITSMIGMPFSFWCNELPVIPEMLPTKTNKKGNKALYKPDKNHKAKVQYRTEGAQVRLTVKLKRGAIEDPLNITDTDPLPPWLWMTSQMTLSNKYLGIHYMRLEHRNKVGKVYKAWKK